MSHPDIISSACEATWRIEISSTVKLQNDERRLKKIIKQA